MRWENCRVRRQHLNDIDREFTSGDYDLDDFWKNNSINYSDQRLSTCYVVESYDEMLAYYSIANDRISMEDFTSRSSFNKFRKKFSNLKKLRGYPAVKLCRLAVKDNMKHQGIGSDIIKYLKYSLYRDSNAACRFLIVDAYIKSIDFYLKNGFYLINKDIDYNKHTVTMYFDLTELAI